MSYAAALKALDKAYSDTGLQQNALIEKIMNLSMDASCPFAWINEAASFRDQIQTFNVTGDVFLRYFLWRGLTDDFKEQLITIVGNSRPSVDEIFDNIHEAKNRIKETKKVSATSKSVLMATTVSKKSSEEPPKAPEEPPKAPAAKPLSCVLCGGEHKIGSCSGFPSAEARVKKLRALKRCTKCTSDSHTDSCDFHFRYKCEKCKEASHFTALCLKPKKQSQPKPDSDSSSRTSAPGSSSNTKVTLSMTSGLTPSNVILPSFTATIESPTGTVLKKRSWVDCCSQDTLIESDLAKEANLEEVGSIDLTIQGFNSNQMFKTKKVLVPIRIGPKKFNIKAICVPKLDINLELVGIDDLVDRFKAKGYELADDSLGVSTRVGGAGLLLGSDNLGILPLKSCSFGEDTNGRVPSGYLISPLGVLLKGRVSKLLADVGDLEHASLTSNSS